MPGHHTLSFISFSIANYQCNTNGYILIVVGSTYITLLYFEIIPTRLFTNTTNSYCQTNTIPTHSSVIKKSLFNNYCYIIKVRRNILEKFVIFSLTRGLTREAYDPRFRGKQFWRALRLFQNI